MGNAQLMASAVDGLGNVYVAGNFDILSFSLGGSTLTRLGTWDAFVAKIDSGGNVLWAQNFGGSGAYATDLALAVDGSGSTWGASTPGADGWGRIWAGAFEAPTCAPALTRSAHDASS